MKNFKLLAFAFLALSLSLTAACGDDHDDHDHEHEHGEEPEYCLHMEEGPATTVDASTDTATDVDFEHKRLDITLGAEGGTIELAIAEAGDYTVALSEATDVTITDAAGTAVTPEMTDESAQCEGAVAVSHTVEFEIGTYTFAFGAAASPLSVVVEHASHEEHE